MMFPNLYRLTQTDQLANLGCHPGRAASAPARRAPPSRPSPCPQPAGSAGSRRNLEINPGVSEFTTAVVVVFSLGAFLFLCGICMLLGGLGDSSSILPFLGISSVVGAVLLTAMGWTLCIKIRQKRNRHPRRVLYYTAVIPEDNCSDHPPAYTAVDAGSPSIPAGCSIPAPPYTPADITHGSPATLDNDGYSSTTGCIPAPAYSPPDITHGSPATLDNDGYSSTTGHIPASAYSPLDITNGSPATLDNDGYNSTTSCIPTPAYSPPDTDPQSLPSPSIISGAPPTEGIDSANSVPSEGQPTRSPILPPSYEEAVRNG